MAADHARTRQARKLLRNRTPAEQKLWNRLRARQLSGEKFVFQVPIGRHFADFACRSARLVVEVDGGHHGGEAETARTRVIEAHGYRVIRCWNHEVLDDLDAVLDAIRDALETARNRPG